MAQQVSPEAAAAAFRQAYGEAADMCVLLRARVTELEQEVEHLRAQQPTPAETGAGYSDTHTEPTPA